MKLTSTILFAVAGVLGIPITQPAPDAPSTPSASSSSSSAAKLLLIGFALASLAACAQVKAIAVDVGKCALGQLPTAVSGIIPDVTATLTGGSPSWASDLEALGAKVGLPLVGCAVSAIVSNWGSAASAAASQLKASLPPNALEAVTRGQAWLAVHDMAPPPKVSLLPELHIVAMIQAQDARELASR